MALFHSKMQRHMIKNVKPLVFYIFMCSYVAYLMTKSESFHAHKMLFQRIVNVISIESNIHAPVLLYLLRKSDKIDLLLLFLMVPPVFIIS